MRVLVVLISLLIATPVMAQVPGVLPVAPSWWPGPQTMPDWYPQTPNGTTLPMPSAWQTENPTGPSGCVSTTNPQQGTSPPPCWRDYPNPGQQRHPPVVPWGNGDWYPMAGPYNPASHRYGWPGYCVEESVGVGPAADGQYHHCTFQTFIPPFSMNAGFGLPFPGMQGYSPNELEDLRTLLRHEMWPNLGGGIPATKWQEARGDTDTSPEHLNDTNFHQWRNRHVAGSKCVSTIDSNGWMSGALRIVGAGWCNPQTGLNTLTPPLNNLGPAADQLSISLPNPWWTNPNTFTGVSIGGDFIMGSGDNQSWWVYYPQGPTNEHPHQQPWNGRLVVLAMGSMGICNWPVVGNSAANRPTLGRLLNEGFAVAMGYNWGCTLGRAKPRLDWGIQSGRLCYELYISFANTYGNYFQDYNVMGNSGGAAGQYCSQAMDPRWKVGMGVGFTMNGTQMWTSLGMRLLAPGASVDPINTTPMSFTTNCPWELLPGSPTPGQAGSTCRTPGTGNVGTTGQPGYEGINIFPLMSLDGLFDDMALRASGTPGERINEMATNDGDADFNGWNNCTQCLMQANPQAFDGKPRCMNLTPCNTRGLLAGYTWAAKNTCDLPPCDQGHPVDDHGVSHYVVPPENIGGIFAYNAEGGGIAQQPDVGHTITPFFRRVFLSDLYQAGPRSQGKMHGGLH